MEMVRRAVIDVGTNSIKLLVADVSSHQIVPVWEGSKQTRLGRDFYQSHRLQPEAISKTANAVAEFAREARELEAASLRIVATSAVRDALNARELTDAIELSAGLKVEILSGAEEADLVFQGVATDPLLRNLRLLLLDVGGGSTEFILGYQQQKHFVASYPLGSVRLLERFPPSDPPSIEQLHTLRQWIKEFLERELCPTLSPAIQVWHPTHTPLQLVGTAGTATILARMEAETDRYLREELESTRLSRPQVTAHVERLWSVSLEERKKIIGLPPKRADVILTGSVIYEIVMDLFHFEELRVSTRGLRFAALVK